jgi:hypothetical protein
MRPLSVVFAAALFLPSIAFAGQLTEKVDRFNGSKQVAWESFSDPGRGYSLNVYAHYADAKDAKPYGYYALLVPPFGASSFSDCHHNQWLVDGKPARNLNGIYESMGSSQTFRLELQRADLESIASASSVEFKICTSEGSISASDLAGVKKLVESTK